MLRDYELLLVIRPTLDNAAAVTLSKQIGELLQSNESAITATNVWGRRKLAYPIDNQIEATYILLKCQITPTRLPDIEFNLKLNDSLLRYMIVRDHTPTSNAVTDASDAATESDTPPDNAEADTDNAPVDNSQEETPTPPEETNTAATEPETTSEEAS